MAEWWQGRGWVDRAVGSVQPELFDIQLLAKSPGSQANNDD